MPLLDRAIIEDDHHSLSITQKVVACIFVLIATLVVGCASYFVLDVARHRPDFYRISVEHFPVVIGLPFGAVLAISVILLFRVVSGEKISVNFLGLKFDGASGPVIMWVICFLAIASAINFLWDKRYTGPIQQRTIYFQPQVLER